VLTKEKTMDEKQPLKTTTTTTTTTSPVKSKAIITLNNTRGKHTLGDFAERV